MKAVAGAAILSAALIVWSAMAGERRTDPATGLVIDEGFDIVKAWCTACHSARLITQAGKTRAGWIDSIRWMQENQGLWDLGDKEPLILDYLSANYGVPKSGGQQRPPVIPLPR